MTESQTVKPFSVKKFRALAADEQKAHLKELSAEDKKALRKAVREAEKAEQPPLVAYRTVADASLLDSEGLLVTHELPNFDGSTHERLKPADFANDASWMRYKANMLRQNAVEANERAEKLEADAVQLETFGGDSKKRAQVKKLQKLAEGMNELAEALRKDGVDVDALLPKQPS